LHQRLEALGNGAFAATHRAQQVKDLLALLQPLRGMAKEAHHLLDGLLHAIELGEGGVAFDDLVGKEPRQARVVARVHHLGLANGGQHALGRRGVSHGITLALGEVFIDRHFLFAATGVARGEVADGIHTTSCGGTPGGLRWYHGVALAIATGLALCSTTACA